MRNYPPFPRATPHQKAGFPRVPHPSATRISEETTFDLHALGTPPALILSQDQTLHQVCPLPALTTTRGLPKRRACFRCVCVRPLVAARPNPPSPKESCAQLELNSFSIFGRPPPPLPTCSQPHIRTTSQLARARGQPTNLSRCSECSIGTKRTAPLQEADTAHT